MGWMLTGNRVRGARDESEWEKERRRAEAAAKEAAVSSAKGGEVKKSPAAEKPKVGERVFRETMKRLGELNEARRKEAEGCSQVHKCVDISSGGLTETEERLADFLGAAEAVISSETGNGEEKSLETTRAVFPELPLGDAEGSAAAKPMGGKKGRKRRRKGKPGAEAEVHPTE